MPEGPPDAKPGRPEIIVSPIRARVDRGTLYEGDLSALPAGARRERQTENARAIHRAMLRAASEPGRPGQVVFPKDAELLEYYLPLDGTMTPPRGWIETRGLSDHGRVPSLWLPVDLRGARHTTVTLEGGGAHLRCFNFIGEGRFHLFNFARRTTVEINELRHSAPEFDWTLDTMDVTRVDDATVQLPAGRAQRFFTGKRVYLHYNRASPTTLEGGSRTSRIVAGVDPAQDRITFDSAVTAGWNPAHTHTLGVLLDPKDYAEHLRVHGRDWAAGSDQDNSVALYGYGSYGGVRHELSVRLNDFTLDGKPGIGIYWQQALGGLDAEGGAWTAQREIVKSFHQAAQTGVENRPHMHWTDTVLDGSAKGAAGVIGSQQGPTGHNWYCHASINARLRRVTSKNSVGGSVCRWSGTNPVDPPEYCEHIECTFERPKDFLIANSEGLTTFERCTLRDVPEVRYGPDTRFLDCSFFRVDSFSPYTDAIPTSRPVSLRILKGRQEGGKFRMVVTEGYDGTILVDGLPELVQDLEHAPAGTAGDVFTMGGAATTNPHLITYRNIGRWELKNFRRMTGSWRHGRLVLKDIPEVVGEPSELAGWCDVRGAGPEVEIENVSIPNTWPFLLSGGDEQAAERVRVSNAELFIGNLGGRPQQSVYPRKGLFKGVMGTPLSFAAATKTLLFDRNRTGWMAAGVMIQIAGTAANDGIYTIRSVTYHNGEHPKTPNTTAVVLAEALPADAGASGRVYTLGIPAAPTARLTAGADTYLVYGSTPIADFPSSYKGAVQLIGSVTLLDGGMFVPAAPGAPTRNPRLAFDEALGKWRQLG